MRRHLAFAAAASLLVACFGGDGPAAPPQAPEQPIFDDFAVGAPQNRAAVGDVERALARYERTRADLIALFEAQPWFQDGLTDDEALFVERSLSFVAGQRGPSFETINPASVRDKLYLHETLRLREREIHLLLIYEPGQDAQRQLSLLKAVIPALETEVGIEWPEKAVTVLNGRFGINDYNDGAFIRIDRCCTLSAFVLAHELAHTYWSMGPHWFNEGMADIYATIALQTLNASPPDGWRSFGADVDALASQRRRLLETAGAGEMTLGRRFASDGLYQLADAFLLTVRDLIGPQAFRAAVAEIYAASDFGRLNLKEKRIQDLFVKRAGGKDSDALMQLFNRHVWGDDGETYRRLQEFEED
jgi:hypothetical protein